MDRKRVLSELSDAVQSLEDLEAKSQKVVFVDNYYALRAVFVVERILSLGLQRGFFSLFTLWEFFETLRDCLPDGAQIIAPFRQNLQTDNGRARAFLRTALNDKALHDYLSALIWNRKTMAKYYESLAPLRDPEFVDELLQSFLRLGKLDFKFSINPALDAPKYWQAVDWSQLLMESNLGKSIELVSTTNLESESESESTTTILVTTEETKSATEKDELELPESPSKVEVVENVSISEKETLAISKLTEASKACLIESGSESRNVLYSRSPSITALLLAVEGVWTDGLDVKFWETQSAWNVVKHIEDLFPKSASLIERCENDPHIQADQGRFRCFVLFALEQGCCSEYLQLLSENQSILEKYYPDPNCLVRSIDVSFVLFSVLVNVESLRLQFESHKSLDGDLTLQSRSESLTPTLRPRLEPQNTAPSAELLGAVKKTRKGKKKKIVASIESPVDSKGKTKPKKKRRDEKTDAEIEEERMAKNADEIESLIEDIVHEHPELIPKDDLEELLEEIEGDEEKESDEAALVAIAEVEPVTPVKVDVNENSEKAAFESSNDDDDKSDESMEAPERILDDSFFETTVEESPAKRILDDSFLKTVLEEQELQRSHMLDVAPKSTASDVDSDWKAEVGLIEEDDEKLASSFATTASAMDSAEDEPSLGIIGAESWQDDISKAFSEIEDATWELESFSKSIGTPVPSVVVANMPAEEERDEPSPIMSKSMIVPKAEPEVEMEERMMKSEIVLSGWARENAPVPTWRRPAVRIATDANLTELICEDYSQTSLRDIAITDKRKDMQPVRLEPSGKVVTVKGEKQKVKTGKKSRSDKSNSILSRVNRALLLELENDLIVLTPQKSSLQKAIYSLTVENPDLAVKNPLCPKCKARLTDKSRRFCFYSGRFYCSSSSCHANQKSLIPARILHEFDFKDYPVAVESLVHLLDHASLPMINVALLNPHLYEHKSLNEVRMLRKQLAILGDFIRVCSKSELLMTQLGSRFHLMQREKLHVYSLDDLADLKGLRSFVLGVISSFASHVRSCTTCRGKGSICAVCKNRELIFPFQIDLVSTCRHCHSIFHKRCWNETEECVDECARCLQIQELYSRRNH